MRRVTVADLFCGAGGSSTGAHIALGRLGLAMDLLCVNHWPIAVETHKRNHPEARHYCQDIATVRPHLAVPDGRLDLLMASPTCTYHSRARGGKPITDQQRMDPWHIVTWLTEIRVRCLIVENVPEFVKWGPVDTRTGKPLKSRRGEYFNRWIETIKGLGFKVDWRVLNAADYGEATTRQRFFLIARSDRQPLRWPDQTHARNPGASQNLFGQKLERWRPAREIIDWTIPGKSIFTRKRPLQPGTLARIYAGALKFGWPEPFLVVLRRHADARGLDLPLPTITAGGSHLGLATPQPFVIGCGGRAGDSAPTGMDAPLGTITTKNDRGVVEPFIVGQHFRRDVKSIDGPVPAITTIPRVGLVEPFMLSQASGGAARGVEEPVPTIPCGGAHALIAPYYGSGSGLTCSSVEQPLPTVTTKDRFAMVMPVTHGGEGNRARDVESDPLPTITCANRDELAFIAAQFGEREGQAPRVHSIDEPAPTICAGGRIQLVEPGRDFDIHFRMLEKHELGAAMGFIGDEVNYEFVGNKTEVNKQIGNAVSVRQAAALVGALMGG